MANHLAAHNTFVALPQRHLPTSSAILRARTGLSVKLLREAVKKAGKPVAKARIDGDVRSKERAFEKVP